MSAGVEFRDVCYSISGRQVLSNLTFSVEPGETLTLAGERVEMAKSTMWSAKPNLWVIVAESVPAAFRSKA